MNDEELLNLSSSIGKSSANDEALIAAERAADEVRREQAIQDWYDRYSSNNDSYTALGQMTDMLPLAWNLDKHPDFTGWGDAAADVVRMLPEMATDMISGMVDYTAEDPVGAVADFTPIGWVTGATDLLWPEGMPIVALPGDPLTGEPGDTIRVPANPVRGLLKKASKGYKDLADLIAEIGTPRMQDMMQNPEDYAE